MKGIDTTILSTYTLIDMNQLKTGRTGLLLITKAERESLKSEIKKRYFSNDLPIGLKAGQYPIDASASIILGFLTDAWKTSDSK
jgi:hypothetical protein